MTDAAPDQPSLPWVARTPLLHLLGLALATGAFLTLVMAALPHPAWVKTGAIEVVQLVVIVCAVRACAARRGRETGRGRVGWTLVAGGFALVGVSVAFGAWYALAVHDQSPASWRDGVSGLGLLVLAGMAEGDTATRVVEGILGMARALDLPVVAEAVETPEQAALLRRMHCELAQGRLFAPPMAPDALELWGRTAVGAA